MLSASSSQAKIKIDVLLCLGKSGGLIFQSTVCLKATLAFKVQMMEREKNYLFVKSSQIGKS